MNWSDYPNFTKAEFDCKETGENRMQPAFMVLLQRLRTRYGKPMIITSGYRSPRHSIEARKAQPGAHAQGIACDVAVSGEDALTIVAMALDLGFSGIGVSQKAGGPRFIHLDTAPRRAIWSY